MENTNDDAQLIERLTFLEYEIRRSITVREDQEEDAQPWHCEEAQRCGIAVAGVITKGDLLNAVQTAVRSAQSRAGKVAGRQQAG